MLIEPALTRREIFMLLEHARGHVSKTERRIATKTIDDYDSPEAAAKAAQDYRRSLEEWRGVRDKLEAAWRAAIGAA